MRANDAPKNEVAQVTTWFNESPPAPLGSARHLRKFLFIAFGIGAAMLLQARRAPVAPVVSRVPLYLALIAMELMLVWFVAIGIRARGYHLVDLFGQRWNNWRRASLDLLCAIATAALLRGAGPILYRFLGRWSTQTGFLLPVSRAESAVWIVVSVTAGVCEELVYRGYLQRQLWSITKSLPAALLLQAAIFSVGHIYQGWKPALVTGIYGLIFGLLAALRRSIIPGAIAHAIADILGGLRL
jgi:membrane protease YdiL (CAAX protease family)